MAESEKSKESDDTRNEGDDDPRWEWEDDPESDDPREVVGEASFEAEGWEDIPADPEDASRLIRALEGIMPDVVKRTLSAGVEGLATGEERIRATISEGEFPKEALGLVLRYADLTKRELLRLISREIRHFLEDMDFGGEIAKILTSLSLEARMQVRFIPNEDAVKPNASGSVQVKQSTEGDASSRGATVEQNESDSDSSPSAKEAADSADTETSEPGWRDQWRDHWERAASAAGDANDPWKRFRRRRTDD